jgi:hypothetical protein
MNMADRLLVVELRNLTLYHMDNAKSQVFTKVCLLEIFQPMQNHEKSIFFDSISTAVFLHVRATLSSIASIREFLLESFRLEFRFKKGYESSLSKIRSNRFA